jgi:cardiolipin synthase
MAYERPGSAFWLFVAAAFTDAADGFVAKRFNGVTSVGAVLDPLADKLLVGCLFVLLAVHGEAPIWLAAIVVVRDIGLVTGGVVLGLRSRGLPIEPLVVGKASTLAQFAFLGCGLATMAGIPVFAQLLGPLQFVTAALTLLSAGAYGIVAWRCIR